MIVDLFTWTWLSGFCAGVAIMCVVIAIAGGLRGRR